MGHSDKITGKMSSNSVVPLCSMKSSGAFQAHCFDVWFWFILIALINLSSSSGEKKALIHTDSVLLSGPKQQTLVICC